MRILIIGESDTEGGAARAAYRLHRALIASSVDSTMLVQNKSGSDETVIGPVGKLSRGVAIIRPSIEQFLVRISKKAIGPLFSSARMGNRHMLREIERIDPDIVHLHWFCGGTLSIEDLRKIKKPIVFTMHDTWLFTGGCHVKYSCEGHKAHCGRCPQVGGRSARDISYRTYRRKFRVFKALDRMRVVALCAAYQAMARESSLLAVKPVALIPNPIDTKVFKKLDAAFARDALSLPRGTKLLMFGAMDPFIDDNKGSKYLAAALEGMKSLGFELLITGASAQRTNGFPIAAHCLGRLHDDYSMVLAYNAADAVVVPSKQENLSNMIMESLACGTPVIAFDVGGNGDMVIHGKNGYLAKPGDSIDLARGIQEVLCEGKDACSEFAIELAQRKYSEKAIAEEMKSLYRDILDEENHSSGSTAGKA